jgi:predicted kinase
VSDAPNVLLIGGPPGVGKTVVGRAIADASPPSAHLSVDTFIDLVRGGVQPGPEHIERRNEVAFRATARAATSYAHAGFFVIIDGIFTPGGAKSFSSRLDEDGELVVDLAILRAPCDVALVRTRERGSVPADGAVQELHERFAALGADERHAVDASGRAVDEIAAEIRSRCFAGELRLAPR